MTRRNRNRLMLLVLAGGAALLLTTSAQAAFVIEVDIDGADNGILTFSPNFGFGGDTSTASQSAPSAAVGLTGGDSIFGGDGTIQVDTYVYTYDIDVDGDNLNLAGTALNDDGDVGSALPAGLTGQYDVYATWPLTSNVSGGPTQYTLAEGGNEIFSVLIDQNTAQGSAENGAGNEWVYLGSGLLDAGKTYVLTQQATGGNTFVSMRAAGVLFDRVRVPEPASMSLLGISALGLLRRRRR